MKLTIAPHEGTAHSIDVPVMEMGVLALYEHARQVPGLPFTLINEANQHVASFTHFLPGAFYSITVHRYGNFNTDRSYIEPKLISRENTCFETFHEALTTANKITHDLNASHRVGLEVTLYYYDTPILTSRIKPNPYYHETNYRLLHR